MTEYLRLKWGTIKGYSLESEAALAARDKYNAAGPQSMSVAMQHDNQAQKLAICELIDVIDGPITSDWSGETLTKEEAKKYVMEYDN